MLRAAQAEFGRHGYAGASLNTIAREAGVAKGSLFQYFEDKASLYVHLGEVATLRVRADMEEQLADLPWDTDFFTAVRVMIGRWEAYFHTHPTELAMTAAVNHEPDEVARTAVRGVVNPHYLAVIEPLTELARDTGQLREGADLVMMQALLLMWLPHIAVAPHRPGLDPVLGLSSSDPEERARALDRLVATLEAAFGRQ